MDPLMSRRRKKKDQYCLWKGPRSPGQQSSAELTGAVRFCINTSAESLSSRNLRTIRASGRGDCHSLCGYADADLNRPEIPRSGQGVRVIRSSANSVVSVL